MLFSALLRKIKSLSAFVRGWYMGEQRTGFAHILEGRQTRFLLRATVQWAAVPACRKIFRRPEKGHEGAGPKQGTEKTQTVRRRCWMRSREQSGGDVACIGPRNARLV